MPQYMILKRGPLEEELHGAPPDLGPLSAYTSALPPTAIGPVYLLVS